MFRVSTKAALGQTYVANQPLSQLLSTHHVSRRFQRHKTTSVKKPVGNAVALELYKQSGYGSRKKKNAPQGDRNRLHIVSADLCGMMHLNVP
jgi:hypothetical protein